VGSITRGAPEPSALLPSAWPTPCSPTTRPRAAPPGSAAAAASGRAAASGWRHCFHPRTAISHNRAIGGEGAEGSDGGNGFGGGAYNEAAASLQLEGSIVSENHANGGEGGEGGSDGEGIGGGVYNLGGFDYDVLTLIFENHASTSHDDRFDL
jgi:hypothetical protein